MTTARKPSTPAREKVRAARRVAREQKLAKAQEQAIALAFEGRWSQAEIAKRCEVSARVIWQWLNDPGIQARLEAMRADFAASVRNVTYADKARRVIALDAMAEAARREFERRPLLIERRPTGRDPDTGELLMMEQEAFNRDAHAAFRDSLNDIAKELGERVRAVDLTSGGHSLMEDLALTLARLRDAAAEDGMLIADGTRDAQTRGPQ